MFIGYGYSIYFNPFFHVFVQGYSGIEDPTQSYIFFSPIYNNGTSLSTISAILFR